MKKPKVILPIKVTPIQGEALRYLVSSRSERGTDHTLTDMSAMIHAHD
jgi:hypothetical protein